MVVMSRERYIAEANRQLSDTDVYKQVSSAVVFDVIEEVKDILSRLQKSGFITEDMATYAVPVDSKPARFYILPKVHKTGCPGRPIVSAVGSPTEGLSELVDHFIQPFVPNIPSYIRDLGSSPSECQIFYLFRCVLSYMLPLRIVGRSNFVRICINLTTLFQKRHILMRTAVLFNGINSGQ